MVVYSGKGVERESALMAWSTMSYRAPDSSIITEFGLLAATAGDFWELT